MTSCCPGHFHEEMHLVCASMVAKIQLWVTGLKKGSLVTILMHMFGVHLSGHSNLPIGVNVSVCHDLSFHVSPVINCARVYPASTQPLSAWTGVTGVAGAYPNWVHPGQSPVHHMADIETNQTTHTRTITQMVNLEWPILISECLEEIHMNIQTAHSTPAKNPTYSRTFMLWSSSNHWTTAPPCCLYRTILTPLVEIVLVI